jgi:hypothetical protein
LKELKFKIKFYPILTIVNLISFKSFNSYFSDAGHNQI